MRLLSVLGLITLVGLTSCHNSKEELVKTIIGKEKKLWADNLITGNEDSLAKTLITDYKEFASSNVKDTLAPEMLYRAAQMSIQVGKKQEAVALYEQVYNSYPNSSRAPQSLFGEAFLYETEMAEIPKAVQLYNQFIQKYPNDELVGSAKKTLEYIGQSPQEMLERILQNKLVDSLKTAAK